jgi:predicted DNA-binding ribbon-helix-helix protein
MSKTIAIPDEVYDRLEQQARERGLAIPQLVAQLAEEADTFPWKSASPTSIGEVEQARLSAALERMRARGLLLAQVERPQAIAAFKPVQVQGKPLSEVILEERR